MMGSFLKFEIKVLLAKKWKVLKKNSVLGRK
ncbi:MAG: hypothetical protein MRERC_9c057 [Mycoplasmataceae bacterium RC_NB112A]|nr:MAG: hypothetical protein MRERC_9c057 [Mycoplasmataceae bacterium RC_NB112A]